MAGQLLKRGDVVACEGRYYVVWNPIPGAIDAFPVLLRVYAARDENVVVAGDELSSWNISELSAAISVERFHSLPGPSTLRIIRVGRCSGGLICRVVAAAARAYCAQKAAEKGRTGLDNNGAKAPLSAAA